jgi:hypothetical protein
LFLNSVEVSAAIAIAIAAFSNNRRPWPREAFMGATNECQMHFRCARRIRDALRRLAEADGVSVATIIKRALVEYLRRRLPVEFPAA